MKRIIIARCVAAGMAAAGFTAAGSAMAAELVLKRVVLSTGGVGYLESEAVVEGDATLTLDVPLDQVDDVLKSLIVYDSAGSAGEITLPGREPLTQSFTDLPFDRAALNSAVDLLNALQGAEIKVNAPRAITGRLVHVDQDTQPGPGGVMETRAWVSVMTETGLQRFALQEADAVAFVDPELQRQVNTALSRIAAYRATGRRQLVLQTHGTGQRTVRVGYVVGMPLWKASYRMSLPADAKAETARLQGWAVLENFSGRAWQDVELTLLSGNPVTFRQALYESYYVPRPNVPVETGGRVLPPADTGTVAMAGALDETKSETLQKSLGRRRDMANAAAPPPPPMAAAMPAPAQMEAATATDETTQIAFTPPYKISVAAGQSLVLPLLDRDLPARRLDFYQPGTNGQRPLATVDLTNKSGTGLPPGVLTLYQQAEHGAMYLGDARLAALPAGDHRLLSYAVDNKTMIEMERNSDKSRLIKATIADGVLQVNAVRRWTSLYRIKAASGAPRQLLIEHRAVSGGKIVEPDPKQIELTGTGAYRVPFTIPDNGEGGLKVVDEEPVYQSFRLLDFDDNQLGVFLSGQELDPKTRQAVADVSQRRQKIGQQRAELARLKEQRTQLVDDEKRLRENLSAIGGDPVVHKRLLDKFNEAETGIETVSAAIKTASATLAASERDLAAYIAHLTI